ncbi:MAG TPA: RDD family protein [Steroidobacteraceae bacterium]|nr:RDD family protein [Steroidobacteraceae bacterium]
MNSEAADLEYVGFWARVGASIIDTILLAIIIAPILHAVYGREYWADSSLLQGPLDFLLNYVLPAVAVIAFWVAKQATPGKMVIGAEIVDAGTGVKPTTRQFIIRYLGYYLSTIGLLLGFVWVAFDARKQGWHDKLANTVVVRAKHHGPQPVTFERAPRSPE